MSELKACPFCGSKVTLMNLRLPIKMFYCNNYRECGAVVSFNNNKCNLEKG
ncbi:MAG: Lar family restriction alleviation protein, partial [Oscillospiraceae bacterium]|nr:Lar family restriction alleviation protein [Oscillospiraceae bacterium]